MEKTKIEMKKHADLIKRYVLSESEKVRTTFNHTLANCVEPKVRKVEEDNGITAKIEVCDTCKKEPCECEKVEETPDWPAQLTRKDAIIRRLTEILNRLRDADETLDVSEHAALVHIEQALRVLQKD